MRPWLKLYSTYLTTIGSEFKPQNHQKLNKKISKCGKEEHYNGH
jgi:hypothetical protein